MVCRRTRNMRDKCHRFYTICSIRIGDKTRIGSRNPIRTLANTCWGRKIARDYIKKCYLECYAKILVSRVVDRLARLCYTRQVVGGGNNLLTLAVG